MSGKVTREGRESSEQGLQCLEKGTVNWVWEDHGRAFPKDIGWPLGEGVFSNTHSLKFNFPWLPCQRVCEWDTEDVPVAPILGCCHMGFGLLGPAFCSELQTVS